MKVFGIFLLLAVSATTSTLKRRQLGDLAGLLPIVTPFIPQLKPISVEYPTPTISGDNIKRRVMKYGPFKLRASSGGWEGNTLSLDPKGTSYSYLVKDFPSDVTVLIPRMLIVHEDGTEISNANKVYNHHAFVYDVSRGTRANLQCKDSKRELAAVNALMGSSADFSPDSLLAAVNITQANGVRVGNYIGKTNQVLLSADLVNYNTEPINVYIITDLTYFEGKAIGYYETAIHLISVGTCEANIFGTNSFFWGLFIKPPENKKQWSLHGETVVKDDGKIMSVRGHMHDGGENMILRLNGKVICDSRAIYKAENILSEGSNGGMSGMISDMSMCFTQIDVKKGDVLSMDANYNLEKHESRLHPSGGMTEQMALMAIVFAKQLK